MHGLRNLIRCCSMALLLGSAIFAQSNTSDTTQVMLGKFVVGQFAYRDPVNPYQWTLTPSGTNDTLSINDSILFTDKILSYTNEQLNTYPIYQYSIRLDTIIDTIYFDTGRIDLDISTLSFKRTMGMDTKESEIIYVTNSGSGILDTVTTMITYYTYNTITPADWLKISRKGYGNQQSLENTIDADKITAGFHYAIVRVAAANAKGVRSTDRYTVFISVTDSAAPAIIVYSHARRISGGMDTIAWYPHGGPYAEVVSRSIYFSPDSGQIWSLIDSSENQGVEFCWKLPQIVSENCLYKVGVYTSTGKVGWGQSNLFSIQSETGIIPEKINPITGPAILAINQNNGKLAFSVSLAHDGNFSIEIYNVMGRRIRSLTRPYAKAGFNQFEIARELSGQTNGIYLARLTQGKMQVEKKFLMTR